MNVSSPVMGPVDGSLASFFFTLPRHHRHYCDWCPIHRISTKTSFKVNYKFIPIIEVIGRGLVGQEFLDLFRLAYNLEKGLHYKINRRSSSDVVLQ